MTHKRLMLAALAVAAAACAAGLHADASSGGSKAQRTIALVRGTDNGFWDDVQSGAEAASTALGDRLVVAKSNDGDAATQSLIAQHVNAIAVDPGQLGTGSSLAQARAAGIATLSYDKDGVTPGSGDVWVTQASPAEFAHALADNLAAQMGKKGRYAVVPCRPSDPVVKTWLHAVEAYVPARYPRMKRLAIVYGNDAGDANEVATFTHLIKTHRRLRGLITLCPTETFIVPQAIIKARKVGKVFVAGNGGDYAYPPVDPQLVRNVRRGTEELVANGDPVKLGYLTVWAADHLVSGQSFAPGQYDVGGPVGTVSYYAANHELRIGRPFAITKANIDQYVGG